jgi:hypothetical protein
MCELGSIWIQKDRSIQRVSNWHKGKRAKDEKNVSKVLANIAIKGENKGRERFSLLVGISEAVECRWWRRPSRGDGTTDTAFIVLHEYVSRWQTGANLAARCCFLEGPKDS